MKMAEYLAPGVYVEEKSFRSKSIEGVGTSTTAFAGPTRKGPIQGVPEVVTSFGEFVRMYGGLENLSFSAADDGSPDVINYMAHAAQAFFNNGGKRLYIARTFLARAGSDGIAFVQIADDGGGNSANFRARVPGSGLNGTITVYEKKTPASTANMQKTPVGTLLCETAPDGGGGTTATYFLKNATGWADDGDTALGAGGAGITRELVSVNLEAVDRDGTVLVYENLALGESHPRFIGNVLEETPSKRAEALENPYYIDIEGTVDAFELLDGLLDGHSKRVLTLSGGNDGQEPANAAYRSALNILGEVSDIAIVAAPGHSAFTDFQTIQGLLISHAEKLKYRFAVLDPEENQSLSAVRNGRSRIDSKYAALYYPWVVVSNPLARPDDSSIKKEITLPPSGFITGIYARTDVERGVWKAPANEVVRGALRFEREITHGQQEVVNPEGINCLRFFFGRGNRVWGARTISSDPEWKYVNVRRYFIYLEHSIDRSTQWAVFEPNGPRLWANIRETVSAFLYNEWIEGALLGTDPEQAYFVRCDRSTMTQADLDNGRLICEIGVAVLKPAEFVIFRIGQKTADAE